jgi:hypothetical protein
MGKSRMVKWLAAALLCGAAMPAWAQATDTGGRRVYEAAFFAPYAPSNAFQIVQRVPGFQLDEGDTEVRGFSQAAGNVVINGQRPSSKGETLDTVLERIPASRVQRVEVGPGDLFASEYSGKPQVVNLVLTSATGIAGSAVATARRAFTGEIFPEGSLSALTKRGNSTFNASIEFDNDQTPDEGTDLITRLPNGEFVELRRKRNEYDDPNGYVSGSWAYDAGANRTAHLNGRYFIDRFRLTQFNEVMPAVGPERDDRLFQDTDLDEFEIGGDVTRPFAGGGLKLLGLVRRRDRMSEDVQLNRIAATGVTTGGGAQTIDDSRDETVARMVWNRSGWGGWNLETGVEGALNKLRSNSGFFSIDASGARTRIDLPVDQATVKEYRGELFINGGRAITPTLRMDLGLTYEASELTVSGDATAERNLQFFKPKASFDWRPGEWHLQFSVARTVAQLVFEDFISVAELSNDRINGGNANIVPQRAWETLLTAERKILGDGLVKFELGYNAISLVQDRIPTPEGFDAPGNLGDGQEYIARATIDVPLAGFGIKGGRLKTYVSYVDNSVEDPYTLRDRRFSGDSLLYGEIEFRQDLGRYAWGFTLERSTPSTFFRRNELDKNENGGPYATLFGEYRPDAKTTVTIGLDNALDTTGERRRTFFTPDRSNPNPNLFEERIRNRHVIPYITLKRNFG